MTRFAPASTPMIARARELRRRGAYAPCRGLATAALLGCTVAAAGCGRGRPPESHGHAGAVLGEVTKAYVGYMRSHGFQPPASEVEFKSVLSQGGEEALRRAGVGSVDALLVSPRDSQPFVIAYGRDGRKLLDREVVAHEQTGVSGQRLVGYSLGYVRELDQASFEQLLTGGTP